MEKDQTVNLTAEASFVEIGFRWGPIPNNDHIDAMVVVVGANDKPLSFSQLVFYEQPQTLQGEVVLRDDDRIDSDDDTVITINLDSLSAEVERIVLIAGTYAGSKFGSMPDFSIRISNDAMEASFDVSKSLGEASAVVFGELYRTDSEWAFRAIGSSHNNLRALVRSYGINV